MPIESASTDHAADPVTTTGDPDHRHITVSSDGRTRATADIDGTRRPDSVSAALHSDGGPLPDKVGQRLVDAVLDLPEVTGSERLQASMPAADGSMAGHIREHFDDVQTRLAGATIVLDGTHEPAPGTPTD